jgi:hypothetical protein
MSKSLSVALSSCIPALLSSSFMHTWLAFNRLAARSRRSDVLQEMASA